MTPKRPLLAAVADAVLVVAFAIAGRSSHAEALDPAGVWATAWPFLAGAAVGWVASLGWRHPLAVWPTGVAVWAGAVAIGMLLRVASGQGTAVLFVVVATIALGALVVGSRVVALALTRSRERGRAGPRPPR